MNAAPRLLALFVLTTAAGCTCEKKPAGPPPPSPVQGAQAPERIDPTVSVLAAYRGMPTQVVFAFPRALAAGEDLNKPLGGKTVLLIEPATKGVLSFTGPSTLTFQPEAPFQFDTAYRFALDAVETSQGVFAPAEPGKWSTTFTTPRFAVHDVSASTIDLRAGKLEVRIEFTGPVAPATVGRFASWNTEGEAITEVKYTAGDGKTVVMAALSSKAIKPGGRVRLELKAGLPSATKPSSTAAAHSDVVDLYGGKKVTIADAHVQEGATGHYIEVFCQDEAIASAPQAADFEDRQAQEETGAYADGEGESEYGGEEYEGDGDYSYRYDPYASYRASPGCVLDEDGAEQAIHFDPPVKFSVTPSRGGFRIFGDFKRGTYALRIDAGAGSVAGGVLYASFNRPFAIPARSPKLAFASTGRYLPRDAWRNLPIQHVNLDEAELTVRHVPPQNLIFWMSDDTKEATDARSSDLILTHRIPLRGEPDTQATSWIDVGSLLESKTRGLLELSLRGGGLSTNARILLTDLSLVAKKAQHPAHGKPGTEEVWAWALDMHTGAPLSGAELTLVRRSGKVIARCTTSGDQGCKLQPDGTDPDPEPAFALIARKGDELTYLKYSELRTDLSDSDVQGDLYASQQKYRAALYSDRGVYRPGDTAHLAAILRGEDSKAPPAMPVSLTLIDPRQRVARTAQLSTNEAGLVTWDVPFAAFADTGGYTLTLFAGGATISSYTFQVEEFVPERMKVTATPDRGGYSLGAAVPVTVAARYLFGGSAEGSDAELTCRLDPADFRPKENASFHYGPARRRGFEGKSITLGQVKGTLDEKSEVLLRCPALGDTGGFRGTARLVASAAVFEAGSGRTTQGEASALLHPEAFYLGLQSGTQRVAAGKAFTVNGLVVDWDGKPAAQAPAQVEVDLFRLESEYGYSYDPQTGYERYQRYLRPVREGKQTVPVAGGKFSVAVTPAQDSAGYQVRVRAGNAQTDLQLTGRYDGYAWTPAERVDSTPRPNKATTLVLRAPELARVGEPIRVTFEAPYRGRVLLTAETDRVLSAEWQEVQAGENTWEVEVERFAPNVYLSAFLVKDPHVEARESFLPDRAFGVASVPVEPTEFSAQVTLTVPEEIRSFGKLPVELAVAPADGPVWATIAAVDEGILSLTRFKSPDPFPSLFVKRALGVQTFETLGWTMLVPPADPSKQTGGDEEAGAPGAGRVQPVKPVALWSGPVKVGPDGKARVEFQVPQYRGSLRVMAVVASAGRVGRAAGTVKVRDPIVLTTTLPRFIARGDEVQIPVFLTNLSGKATEVKVELSAEDLPVPGSIQVEASSSPLQLLGKREGTVRIEDGKSATVVFQARAVKSTGAAKLRVRASGGGHESHEELDVPFLPAGPRERLVQKIVLTEGVNDLKPHLRGWLPGSESTTIWVTNNPYGESFDHLKYLIQYPYGCIEQTTSSTRPLLFVGNLLDSVDPTLLAGRKLEEMVMAGVNRVFSMQTPSGGFAYWPGQTDPQTWGTAYATHMLIDAQKAGYPIPQERLNDAIGYLERELTQRESGGGEAYWSYDEPYLHYVTALAGRGRKARIEKQLGRHLAARPDSHGEHDEQVLMLKAALYLAGDRRYEKELRKPDATDPGDYRANSWSFYSARRHRGFALSVFQDLFGNDPAGEPLAEVVARMLAAHPSYYYTTQELLWGITGLGKRIKGAQDFKTPVLLANGKPVKHAPAREKVPDRTWALARASELGSLTVQIEDALSGKLWAIVSTEGVREQAEYALGGNGLAVQRRFKDLEGRPLDPYKEPLELAQLVVVEVELTNTSNVPIQNIALVDRLPAGFEIENPRLSRGAKLDWLDGDEVWQADYLNLRDDRLELFGMLQPGQSRKVVYAARVVTSGKFAVPPVEAEAMYDPRFWARAAGGELRVSGPWKDFLL